MCLHIKKNTTQAEPRAIWHDILQQQISIPFSDTFGELLHCIKCCGFKFHFYFILLLILSCEQIFISNKLYYTTMLQHFKTDPLKWNSTTQNQFYLCFLFFVLWFFCFNFQMLFDLHKYTTQKKTQQLSILTPEIIYIEHQFKVFLHSHEANHFLIWIL